MTIGLRYRTPVGISVGSVPGIGALVASGASRGARAAVLLLACTSGGCAADHDPTPASPRPPAQLDCGAVRPVLELGCNDGEPDHHKVKRSDDDERPLHEGLPGVSVQLRFPGCALAGPAEGDKGLSLRADFRGACVAAATSQPGPRRFELAFEADVERICSTKSGSSGSSSEIGVDWRGALALPGPGSLWKIEATATSTRTYGASCRVRVGDVEADPIATGSTRLASLFVHGEATVPLSLACTRVNGEGGALASVGCYGYAPGSPYTGPHRQQEKLTLGLSVARCPEDC